MPLRLTDCLNTAETALLHAVLDRRNPSLAARIRLHEAVSRSDSEGIVTVLGDELINNLDDEWEPTEYGRAVTAVLARFNAHRIGGWP